MSAIKLVVAFGREDHAIQKYEKMAQQTKETATKAGIRTNYSMNFFITCIVSFTCLTGTFCLDIRVHNVKDKR